MSEYIDKDITCGELKRAIERIPTIEISEDCISRKQAIEAIEDMGEVSDGYHTFNQLYHQRAVLFATIVNQNKDKAWKSWKHEDGKFCFDKGGEWFIVGVDTPEGSYTYHYEQKYWDMFDCEELDSGKHWDGHTEEDVTRLLSLPPVPQKQVTSKLKNPDDSLLTDDSDECKEQKSKLDCISRQDAIEALDRIGSVDTEADREYARDIYDNLPPVTPTERTGEWIVSTDGDSICSVCGASEEKFIHGTENWRGYGKSNYCPNCGAKMGGDTE